jgi:hypothetical protein
MESVVNFGSGYGADTSRQRHESTRSEQQYSDQSLRPRSLAVRYGINPETPAKWKKRFVVHDAPLSRKSRVDQFPSLDWMVRPSMAIAFIIATPSGRKTFAY